MAVVRIVPMERVLPAGSAPVVEQSFVGCFQASAGWDDAYEEVVRSLAEYELRRQREADEAQSN